MKSAGADADAGLVRVVRATSYCVGVGNCNFETKSSINTCCTYTIQREKILSKVQGDPCSRVSESVTWEGGKTSR